ESYFVMPRESGASSNHWRLGSHFCSGLLDRPGKPGDDTGGVLSHPLAFSRSRMGRRRSFALSDPTSFLSEYSATAFGPRGDANDGCFDDVKIWMSGGQRSGSSMLPTRTNRTAAPAPA